MVTDTGPEPDPGTRYGVLRIRPLIRGRSRFTHSGKIVIFLTHAGRV